MTSERADALFRRRECGELRGAKVIDDEVGSKRLEASRAPSRSVQAIALIGACDAEDPVEANDPRSQNARVIERTGEPLRSRGEGKPGHRNDGRRVQNNEASGWNEAQHRGDNVLRRKKKARLSGR